MIRRRLTRGLLVLGGLALCWTLAVMWTGGTVWSVGGVRISSRGPRNPALLSILTIVAAWAVAGRAHALAAEYRWLVEWTARRLPRIRWSARLVVVAAAVGVVLVGLIEGAGVVGGSDSYGYVSQAHLLSAGRFRQEPELHRRLAPEVGLDALAPLGYRPTVDGTTIAPTYSPGLPIVMAIFLRLGGPDSVFWVVPVFGGVLVWATYLLGARLHGRAVGAIAAVLVAASPPLLIQLTAAPMSDVPAAAWWTLTFVLACMDRRAAAVGAGAAAGAAILTRPNLVPVLLVAAAFLAARLSAAGRPWRDVSTRLVLFALLSIPACVVIAVTYGVMWGWVLKSGYGSLNELFDAANVWPNVLLYSRALVTEVPLALLAPIAWFVTRDRVTTIALGAWAAVVALVYIAYPAYDAAWNLRFLLPAIPALLVLAGIAAFSFARRWAESHRAAGLLTMALVAGYGVHTARGLGAFDMEYERRYPAIGEYIARELPERAVLISMLHSGSANFYSGRPTVRYDLLAPSRLDPVVGLLRERGYVPHLLLDATERQQFQDRYHGHSRLAALDWPPLVRLSSPPVEIYPLPPPDPSRP